MWAVVVVCVLWPDAARAEGVSLEAYVARVLDASAAARVLEADVEVARGDVAAAGLWPNPRAEVSRQANAVGVRAGETQDQAVLSVPLVLSGRLGLEQQSASRSVDATVARVAHARGQLRHAATEAFLAVVAARERAKTQRASFVSLTAIVDAIRAREKAGEAAGYDRVRAELELARVEAALAAAADDELDALAVARGLWPADAGALVVGDRDLRQPLGSNAPASSLEERGDVRALAAEGEAARLAASAAGRRLIPDPVLSGGAMLLDVIEDERGVGYVASVEVPLPLFDRGQGEEARARARAARTDAERALLVHTAQTELDAARARLEASRTRARRHDEDVLRRARELERTTLEGYRAGGMDLLLLVDAERASIEAELTAITLAVAALRAENDTLWLAGAYDAAPETER